MNRMNMMNRIIHKPKRIILLALLTVLLLSLVLVAAAAAQTGSGFDLSWHVVGSGGGRMTGGAYQLDGTLGQVAVAQASGSGDTLFHGFWQDFLHLIRSFLPMTMKH
jgi:large exoprotein involved in heme utilization and adhesion